MGNAVSYCVPNKASFGFNWRTLPLAVGETNMSDWAVELKEKHPSNFSNCFDFSPADAWSEIISETIEQMIRLEPEVQIVQVKQKFGSLRLYYDVPFGTSDEKRAELHNLVFAAEIACDDICENCGKRPASKDYDKRNAGWVKTLCESCGTSTLPPLVNKILSR